MEFKPLTRATYRAINEIVQRAESKGLCINSRISAMMDIEFAYNTFNLDLEAFKNASDLDFSHDFCGIQNSLDREKKVFENGFLPRFAKRG